MKEQAKTKRLTEEHERNVLVTGPLGAALRQIEAVETIPCLRYDIPKLIASIVLRRDRRDGSASISSAT